MDIHVQNSLFRDIGLIENYDSFIWTDRYASYGDFELVLSPNGNVRELLDEGSYLSIPTSTHTMFLESTFEDTKLKITGRSLESVFERRVIEGYGPNASTSLSDYIRKLIIFNIMTPAGVERSVDAIQMDFSLPAGFTDPLDYEAVKYGDNLYEVVKNLMDNVKLGYQLINQPQQSSMLFQFTYGRDLTKQVIFSESIGNIHDLTQLKSDKTLKNVAVVNLPPWDDTPGLGEIWRAHKNDGTIPMGLNRREIWTDASDLRKDDSFNATNKPSRAVSWGLQELAKYPAANDLDFQISRTNQYIYDVHYKLGDIVNAIAPSGEGIGHRVTEYIQSFGPEGNAAYPTLTAV